MHPLMRICAAAAVMSVASGCSLYSTATHWNGRADPSGKPMFIKSTIHIGFNLGILIPILGDTSIDEMIDVTTAEIAKYDSDGVRLVQTDAENYWYGFPPFTWIITPVITSIAVEYNPSLAELRDAEVDIRVYERQQEARKAMDEAAAEAATRRR